MEYALNLQCAVINTKVGSFFHALLDVMVYICNTKYIGMHSLPLNISLARFCCGFSLIDERLPAKVCTF
jgi:hypothetical protein